MYSFLELNSYSENDIAFLLIKNNHSNDINPYFIENYPNTNYTNQLKDDFSDFNQSFPENAFNSIFSKSDNNELNDENNDEYIYLSPKKEKKKIFYTKREIKKGRKIKCIKYIGDNGKSRQDLIRTKIKIKFLNSLLNYINNKIILFYTSKKYLLKSINSPFIKETLDTVKECLDKKIIEIFSCELSKKYNLKKLENFSNKKIINKIIKENKALELIDIFINKSLKDMYEIYISNSIDNFCLKNDIEKLSKKNEYEQEYLKDYETKAKNFVSIIQGKKSKNKNIKKKLKKK